jgi:hypothetical protein
MDECGAMLWGRVTYEMMESYWPAVTRGSENAPARMRAWAEKRWQDSDNGRQLMNTAIV